MVYKGPTQLGYQDHELSGQGPAYHNHGFSTPIGLVKGLKKSPADLTEQELKGLHQSLNGIQEILKDIRLSQQGMDSSLKQMQKDSLVGNKHR